MDVREIIVRCIRCDKDLDNIPSGCLQPIDGLAFTTYGHYGSTYFDPMNGSRLEIAICDACVEAAELKGVVCRFDLGTNEVATSSIGVDLGAMLAAAQEQEGE